MIQIHYEAGQFLSPAKCLQKAADALDLKDIDLEIFTEPCVASGKPHWAFDNYRLNGSQGGEASVVFYTQPGWGNYFEKLKGRQNIQLQSYAVDPELHKPYPEEKIYDVGFIGQFDGDDRPQYLDVIRNNFNCFISNGVASEDLSVSLSRCKVLFNYIRTEEINIRFFEELAIGTQITSYSPALHLFAREGIDYATYKTPEEAVAKIRFLLDHEDVCSAIAKNARSWVLQYHTYDHRIRSMLEFLRLI